MAVYKEKYNKTLLLYSTSGCHLCEQAKSLIDAANLKHQFTLEVIDIANDDELFKKYAIRIPVIRFERSLHELSWPFDLDELDLFVLRMF